VRNPAFNALIDEIRALHESKNHDYTPDSDPLANLRRARQFGIDPFLGVLVRLSDKWSRIEQLTSGKTPKHESLRDSLIDNAVYSLLAVLLLDERKPVQVEAIEGAEVVEAAPLAYVRVDSAKMRR
jgi:hypothetical protein